VGSERFVSDQSDSLPQGPAPKTAGGAKAKLCRWGGGAMIREKGFKKPPPRRGIVEGQQSLFCVGGGAESVGARNDNRKKKKKKGRKATKEAIRAASNQS